MTTTYSTPEGEMIEDHCLITEVLDVVGNPLVDTFPRSDFFSGKTFVIKLGGSALEYQRSVLQDIVWLRALGAKPVLVHGGGPYINEWLHRLNVPTRFENGLRVTDARTLDIVRMVLLGQVNSSLVLVTTQLGGRAVGLSGTDGNMVRACIADERLGFVGKIEAIDPTMVQLMLDQEYIPIIAPLGLGNDGACLNINADLVAAHLAGALHAEKLIFLSDVAGIYSKDGSLIPELTAAEARQLIQAGVIRDGMIPKVIACLDALLTVPCLHILDGREPHALLRELFSGKSAGTVIVDSRE